MARRPVGRPLVAAALAAGGAALLGPALRQGPWAATFERTNHAGRPVSLLEGPAYVLAAGAAAALAGPAPVLAAAGTGAFGALDDLAGDSTSKGLRGHLGALRRGRVTTGAAKVAGIGLTGLAVAALADRDRAEIGPVGTLLGGLTVAAAANVANLLDLRPGRAIKASTLAALPLLLAGRDRHRSATTAAATLGAGLGVLRDDLAGTTMLGDTGANAVGALWGTALLGATGTGGRAVALGLLSALTLASERVSFTAVIESTPGLRELDAWGRRRPPPSR